MKGNADSFGVEILFHMPDDGMVVTVADIPVHALPKVRPPPSRIRKVHQVKKMVQQGFASANAEDKIPFTMNVVLLRIVSEQPLFTVVEVADNTGEENSIRVIMIIVLRVL